MKFRTRILLSSLMLLISFFVFYSTWMIAQLTPRYIEITEDNLFESATILSQFVSSEIENGQLDTKQISQIFEQKNKIKIFAKINEVTKTKLQMETYFVNSQGIVLFDSSNKELVGKDYSKWNDVFLTLKGQYGTRITNDSNGNGFIFVGAPIWFEGKIIGCLTAYKPLNALSPYIIAFQNKFLSIGIYALIMFAAFSVLILAWILIPLKKLVDYSRNISEQFNLTSPKDVTRKDEFSILTQDLHAMSTELDERLYIENYLHVLTHELKGPISAIKGASEILEQNITDQELKKFSNNISFETNRIQDLILKFLEIASLEFHKNTLPKKKQSLNKILEQAIKLVSQQAIANQILIEVDLSRDSMILANEVLLTEAFTNILRNAISFSAKNQKVCITTVALKDKTMITIRDYGSGIPAFALDKVFDKFYSLKNTVSNKKSTGLGLSFVKEVIKQHGAEIQLQNAEEQGVVVTVSVTNLA